MLEPGILLHRGKSRKMARPATALLLTLLFLCLPASATTQTDQSLDRGFRFLYNLDFPRAQQEFASWEQGHSDNPVGPVSEAAGLLFSEFHRLGILEAQFYENDAAFKSRKRVAPDATTRERFNAALQRAETLARARLARDPKDRDGLFAMTLSAGLKADYAAMIEKRNLASLRFTKEATGWAQQLLAVDPNCYDAHVAMKKISRTRGSYCHHFATNFPITPSLLARSPGSTTVTSFSRSPSGTEQVRPEFEFLSSLSMMPA